MTMTGRDLRLSRSVARLSGASAVVTRRHSMSDRDGGTKLGTLLLDGIHAAAVTTLTMKAPDSGPLVGRLPNGITLTIGGTPYATTATATADLTTSRITVTITPGLDAEGADEAVVTLADSVDQTHPKVTHRTSTAAEFDHHMSAGREVTAVGALPGHLAPDQVEIGDSILYTLTNGQSVGVRKRVEAAPQFGWGQRVMT